MACRYYTSFLLDDPAEGGIQQVYGVVEVDRRSDRELADAEIRFMLAQNFDVDTADIDVLLWSRIH